MSKIIITFVCIIFFLSCGNKSEKWIYTDEEFKQNSITITENKIHTHLSMINSNGDTYYENREYTIDETIYHERDKNQRIHILYNKKKNAYSVLPELIIDPRTRKYLPYEANIDIIHNKEELIGHLYEKIQIRDSRHSEEGPLGIPQFYAYFGHLKQRGPTFKKE